MKFDVIVGNPPYQISDGGAKASAKPIYQHYVLLGKEISSNYTCFITPTRWFTGGKGLDGFRSYMLSDKTLKELHDFLTPSDIFPNANIRGGVCYFISDLNKVDDNARVITYQNNEAIANVRRKLALDGVDIFIRDSIGLGIIEKTMRASSMMNSVSARNPFGFRGYFTEDENYKEVCDGLTEPILCYGKGKKIGFVERELIKKNIKWVDSWKVFIPRANNIGTELNDDNLNAFVGKPNEICTESYIVVGGDLLLDDASSENLVKYLKTKFVRYMHSLAKVSQDASSKTFRFIPMQDFTSSSDIDWKLDIFSIDKQLYKKYNLSQGEVTHIETKIKSMI